MKKANLAEDVRRQVSALSRRSLSEEAADTLRELILLEKLAPGTAVSESDLAEALGISRTPLREALRLLEIDGLIEYSSTRRAQIADPSVAELSQYISVLGALEALAGEIACAEAADDEITAIIDVGEDMADGIDKRPPLDSFRLDMKFHSMMVEAARNAPLIETHRQYNARLWRARFISSCRTTGRETTLAEHKRIAGALRSRDSEAVGRALRGHHKSTIKNIEKAMKERVIALRRDV